MINDLAVSLNNALDQGDFQGWAVACARLDWACHTQKLAPTVTLKSPSHEWDRLNPHWVALRITLEKIQKG